MVFPSARQLALVPAPPPEAATDNGWVIKAQSVDPAGNTVTLIENTPRAD